MTEAEQGRAASAPANIRVPGHGLVREGWPVFDSACEECPGALTPVGYRSKPGHGQCSCGATSPHGSLADRQRWHRQHKVDVVAARQVGPAVTKTGRVLTNADFEVLAAEAEAGYDIEHLIARPARRRSVDADAPSRQA